MRRIALINDLSGFGKCYLTAAIPVISVMGMQACPLPTAILSSQCGFKNYFCDDYTDNMEKIAEKWKQIGVDFDGIYSGYLTCYEQVEKLKHFLEDFKKENTIYLCDPVMADNGRPYSMFCEIFLNKMKQLTLKADVITPNLSELCLLANKDFFELTANSGEADYIQQIENICKRLLSEAEVSQTIIVTGIITNKNGRKYMGNLAVNKNDRFYIENEYIGKSFSGTGDLFASVICGSMVKGVPFKQAVETATNFIQSAVTDTANNDIDSNHGVNFEKYLFQLMERRFYE